MKEIYKFILELTSRMIQMGNNNYHNYTWWRKIINHVGLEVYVSPKARKTPFGKPSLHKVKYILGGK